MLARIDDNPAFFRLAMVTQGTSAQGAEAVGAELALISLDIARLIRDLYEDGVAAGDFRPMDPIWRPTSSGSRSTVPSRSGPGSRCRSPGSGRSGDGRVHPPRAVDLSAAAPPV